MTSCKCSHDRVLHAAPNGPCLALIVTNTSWRCGCPEYRKEASEPVRGADES